jgi:hypothetical protein
MIIVLSQISMPYYVHTLQRVWKLKEITLHSFNFEPSADITTLQSLLM